MHILHIIFNPRVHHMEPPTFFWPHIYEGEVEEKRAERTKREERGRI
jgi:hypothetical protein